MSFDRRKFMKLAGLTALGVAGGKTFEVFAEGVDPIDSTVDTTAAPTAATPAAAVQPPKPLTAKRWAMIVDVPKCIKEHECDHCAAACHEVHNVPDFGNPKDEVKWIWKEPFHHAFHEMEHELMPDEVTHHNVLVFCNHCDNPPCVRVCPTKATWQREDGIVMMDQHRCIGCRYCVTACPYGARSFNWRDPRPHIKEIDPTYPTRTRGVVEKCTFCAERLAQGKIPACVEVCKAQALLFGDLEDPNSHIRKLLRDRFSIRRKASLGTQPEIYYLV